MKKLLELPMKSMLAALLLVFAPVAASAQMPPPADGHRPPPPPPPMQRSITVQGDAHGEFQPDQAVIRFAVVTRDKELAAAKKANDAMMHKVLAVTQKFDIPKDKVVTSGTYISPEYNYNRDNNRPKLIGYMVNRSMNVVTKDLSRQEELLSAIVETKVDEVNNVEFQLSDPDKHEADVRVKAFADAKAKAQALAEAAGAKLGPALFISTVGGMDMPRPPRPMMAMAESRAMAADSASVAPTLPGMITIRETVNVTFALE